MNEYTFLIPTVRDSSKKPHSPQAWKWLESTLVNTFDGFSVGGFVRGQWRGSDGICEDSSKRFSVATDSGSGWKALVAILQECKLQFDQQAIYVVQTGQNTKFV